MDVPRIGFGAVLEWMVAAGCVVGVVSLASTGVRELRDVEAIPPVIAVEPSLPDPPASMFPGAVFVPVLLLSTGEELRVGQRASLIAERLNQAWQIGADALERSERGHRVVRRYDDGATQFAVVLEPGDVGGEERVVGIYLR